MIKQGDSLRLRVLELASADLMGDLEVVCISRLRYLPGRRSVWKARCEGRDLLLKLYDPHPKQKRDAGGEWKKSVELHELELDVADPLFFAKSDDGLLAVAMAFIPDGQTLDVALANADPEDQKEALRQLVGLHVRQHDGGCFQGDDHLGNYLWSEGKLWMLDAGTYHFGSGSLPKLLRVKNMAMLAANVPLPLRSLYDAAFDEGYQFPLSGIGKAISKAIDTRARNYYKKTRRACTEFEHEQGGGQDWLACRDIDPLLKQKLRSDPDQFFQSVDDDDLLKNGNTCTVVEIVEGGTAYILKRYNQKPLGYRLTHLLMTPRALLSWSNGHVLRLFGVPTPRPVACLLLKTGPMVRQGYLLMEKAIGEPLLDVAEDRMSGVSQRIPQQFAQRWQELDTLNVTHGDFKANNLIVEDDGTLVFIDLDGLTFHRSLAEKQRSQIKDLNRFMQNWQEAPQVAKAFIQALK